MRTPMVIRRWSGWVASLGLGLGSLTAADPSTDKEPAAGPTAIGDWYCIGYSAEHSYTSPDRLPPPLKPTWTWMAPKDTSILHAVSSSGKVFVHGLGGGCHNWMLDVVTGTLEKKDPTGTSANDFTKGHPVGTCDGVVYQCDDGGIPFAGADVWSPVQLSPTEGFWAVVQQSKIDGPNPGIYCMKTGAYIGSGWWSGVTIPGTNMAASGAYCQGDIAMGPGMLYTATHWEVPGTEVVNGLACFDLAGGKRHWKLDGKFISVSAGPSWCIGIDERNVMVVVNPTDGKVLTTQDIPSMPECPPMVDHDDVRIYDESGSLTSYHISEKSGKWTIKRGAVVGIGRFEAQRVRGRYNCPFCCTADGAMYVANGTTVMGIPKNPKEKRWTWTVPPDLAKELGPVGHPIIARGKLVVVGRGGVAVFDTDGHAPTEKSKK